jgi:hypothetical protein
VKRRRRRRRRKVYSKLTQRTPSATALPRCRRRDPPYYVPEGDSPLSLHATVLSIRVVLSFVSRHRAGVRATTPVEQVRGGRSGGGGGGGGRFIQS